MYSDFVLAAKSGLTRVAAWIALLMALEASLAAQVSVTISPPVVTLATMAVQDFKATVVGSTNTAVRWEVDGISGGNSTDGLISTTLLGTANAALYLCPFQPSQSRLRLRYSRFPSRSE
jgi:hypothetical protein